MKKNIIYSIFFILIFAGCNQEVKSLYVWGDYTKSSSEYGMKGHEKEVLEKHLTVLKNIIDESEQKKERVAPGIYAEYAQILYETNKKEDAKRYFILEKQTYPESSRFIDRVLAKLYGEQK